MRSRSAADPQQIRSRLTTKISIPAPWKAIARASGRVAVVHAALDVRAQASLLALALARRGDVVLVGPGRDRAVALARRWLPRARGGRSGRVRVVRAGGCVLWLAESPEDLDDLAADSLAGLFAHGCNGLGENPAVRAGAADAGLVVLAGQAPTRGHWFAHAANGEDGYDVVRIPWRAAVGAFPDQAEKVGDLEDRRNRRMMELEGAEPPPLALAAAARRRLWIRTDKPARLLSAGQRASAALAGGATWEASGAPPIVPAELLPMQRRYVAMKRLGRARGFTKFIVPKYRRGGITSIEQIESYLVAADRPNSWVLSLADTDRKARNIFPTVKLFHDRDPDAPPLIGAGSESMMRLANGSRFAVGTASGSATARGETYQRIHGSEVPYWCPGQRNAEEMDSVMAALTRAASNGEVSLEGTPNGREWFYHLYQDAKRGVVPWWPIFLRWFDDPLNVASPGTYEPEEVRDSLEAEEQDLIERHGLTLAQIAWRRATKGELRRLFKQEYPEDDESAFMSSGTCYFDVDKVIALSKALRTYERRHVPGGYEVEWEAPEKGVEYVIGCDTSEGIPGCDPCGLGVLRRDTGAQVATVHGIFNPPTLAAHVVRVHRRYNDALVGIERQNHGHAVLQKVLELGLDRPHFHGGSLYYFKRGTDQVERGADGMAWTRHGRPGWSTDGETRPVMLQQMAAAIEDGSMKVRDADLLSECLSFRLQTSGRFEADSGAHDDAVFKWAIAWQMRKHRVVKPGIMVLEGSL